MPQDNIAFIEKLDQLPYAYEALADSLQYQTRPESNPRSILTVLNRDFDSILEEIHRIN